MKMQAEATPYLGNGKHLQLHYIKMFQLKSDRKVKILDLGFLHIQQQKHFRLHSYEKFFTA